MAINLMDFKDNEHVNTLAEAIGHIYQDKIIQVYFSESGGNTHYSDLDVNSNLYVEGKVLWGRGEVFALECEVKTPEKIYQKQIIFNAWGVTFISEKSNVALMLVLKGMP